MLYYQLWLETEQNSNSQIQSRYGEEKVEGATICFF